MPQPMHYTTSIGFDFGRNAVLQRPKLAPFIPAIIMHWNEIEARIAVFLASLLGGEAKTVIRVFLSLTNDGAKRAAIDTIAELKLSTTDLAKFKEIQITIGKRYTDRNNVVHCAWGVSDLFPDHLLWADVRESTAMLPDLMALAGPDKKAERMARLIEEQKKIMVYNKKDFEDIIERLEAAHQQLVDFTDAFTKPIFEAIQAV